MANAVKTGDRRLSQIKDKKQNLLDQLSTTYQPEVIQPKFKLNANEHHKALISIRDADLSYANRRLF